MSNVITRERRGLGWFRDIFDPRDHRAGLTIPSREAIASLPAEVELWTPPIMDQGRTNSCTGHASASLYRYMLHYLGHADFQPSRSFNYWYGRKIAHRGWESVDEGAMPRDVMQSMISNGVVDEADWPFDPARINEQPPKRLLTKALGNRVIEGEYTRMLADHNLYHLKASLARRLPFLVGIDVYSSFFDTGDDGHTPMPQTNETFEGGHLIYCNGYSEARQRFRCPNSWGLGEGDKGVFWLPYPYVANAGLAGDFWRIEAIT